MVRNDSGWGCKERTGLWICEREALNRNLGHLLLNGYPQTIGTKREQEHGELWANRKAGFHLKERLGGGGNWAGVVRHLF